MTAGTHDKIPPAELAAIRESVCDRLAAGGARRAGTGYYAIKVCVFCDGKRKAGVHPDKGYKCFACGWHPIEDAAPLLGVMIGAEAPRPARPEPAASRPASAPSWQRNAAYWHNKYLEHPRRLELWQAYKPLALESIARYQLGVGVLPPIGYAPEGAPRYTMNCGHARLIYANLETGKPSAFRGRQFSCDCYAEQPGDLKWLTVKGGGVWLWGASALRPGAKIVIPENPIDAILAMQRWPEALGLAGTGGGATFPEAWIDLIIASKPAGVKLALDNDHVGLPNAETRARILGPINAERASQGKPALKISTLWDRHGARLAAAGVRVARHDWPAGSALGADLGSMLIAEGLLL